jgi:tetratricopeptide (TPR) repeat protein
MKGLCKFVWIGILLAPWVQAADPHASPEKLPPSHGAIDTHAQDTHGKPQAKPGADKGKHVVEKPTPRDLLELLHRQLEHQSWDLSRAIVESIVNEAPLNSPEAAEALLLAARFAGEHQRHGESIVYYERWRKLSGQEGNLAQVLVELGRQYRKIQAIKVAVDCFYSSMKQARLSQSGSIVAVKAAQWEVAETSYLLRDWERARKLFEMFTESYKDEDLLTQSAYYRMGDCSRELGDLRQTVVDYERALTHNPDHPFAPEARVGLLETFLKQENYPRALQVLSDLAESVVGMPMSQVSYWKRRSGEVLFRYMFHQSSPEITLKILETLGKIDASSEWQKQIGHWKGLVYLGEFKWDEALKSFPKEASDKAAPAEKVESAKASQDGMSSLSSSQYADYCQWILNFQKKQEELQLPLPHP